MVADAVAFLLRRRAREDFGQETRSKSMFRNGQWLKKDHIGPGHNAKIGFCQTTEGCCRHHGVSLHSARVIDQQHGIGRFPALLTAAVNERIPCRRQLLLSFLLRPPRPATSTMMACWFGASCSNLVSLAGMTRFL